MDPGQIVPPELSDLTPTEEMLIARAAVIGKIQVNLHTQSAEV